MAPHERNPTVKHALILASLAVLALGGCGEAAKQAEPAATEGPSSGPDAKPGLSATGGVLVLPAVKGNPGVAYFALSNGSDKVAQLAAVFVDGAGKAEMHETMGGSMAPMKWAEIKPGETVKFERGGKHVMLFDVAETLKAGGTTEMTLTFKGGDKLSAPLKVEAAGGAM